MDLEPGDLEVTGTRILEDDEPLVIDRSKPYFLVTIKDRLEDGSYTMNLTTEGLDADELGSIIRTIAINY